MLQNANLDNISAILQWPIGSYQVTMVYRFVAMHFICSQVAKNIANWDNVIVISCMAFSAGLSILLSHRANHFSYIHQIDVNKQKSVF